jgi:membrane AbrB-like protein
LSCTLQADPGEPRGDARISLTITVIAVLVFGSVGAFVGYRLPVPAGVLVGTLVGVGVASVLLTVLLGLPQPSVPSFVNALLQIMLGMLVGFRMTREELRSGVPALIPASLATAVLVFSAIGSALLVVPFTSVDIVTALFAAAPGGLTEMSVVSVSFGADGAAVATVQLVRVLLALVVINILLRRFESKGGSEPASHNQEQDSARTDSTRPAEHIKGLGVAAPWGILGGLAGIVSSAPAGGIIGALIGSAAFRLLSERPVPVRKFQLGVQALGGGVIGLSVSSNFLSELVWHAGAWALILFTQMLLWLTLGWLLVRLFRYDLSTATLASTPGGMSAVISTAGPAGADVVIVTFFHLMRLSTIIVVVPVLVALIFGR